MSKARDDLLDRYRVLEDQYRSTQDKNLLRLMRALLSVIHSARCRMCSKVYDARTARGEWNGYCSAKCQHAMARKYGWRKRGERSEYQVLNTVKEIGTVFMVP